MRPVVPGRGRNRHPHRPGTERRPTRGMQTARPHPSRNRATRRGLRRIPSIPDQTGGLWQAAGRGIRRGAFTGLSVRTYRRQAGRISACMRIRVPRQDAASIRGGEPATGARTQAVWRQGWRFAGTRSGAGRRPKDTVPDSGADCAITVPETFESGSPARLKSVIAQDTSGGAAPDRRSECRGRSAPNEGGPDPVAGMRVWGRRRGRRRRFLHRRCVFPHASGPPTARAQDQLRRRRCGG